MNKKQKKKYCCVPQCKNNANKLSSYHLFPKDVNIKRKWLKNLKMKYSFKFYKVCSNHFCQDDYFWNGEFNKFICTY